MPHCHHASYEPDSGTFALVLEDAGPAEVGDDIVGATLTQADLAVRALAQQMVDSWDDYLAQQLQAPHQSLIHGDFRLDNLLFGQPGAARRQLTRSVMAFVTTPSSGS